MQHVAGKISFHLNKFYMNTSQKIPLHSACSFISCLSSIAHELNMKGELLNDPYCIILDCAIVDSQPFPMEHMGPVRIVTVRSIHYSTPTCRWEYVTTCKCTRISYIVAHLWLSMWPHWRLRDWFRLRILRSFKGIQTKTAIMNNTILAENIHVLPRKIVWTLTHASWDTYYVHVS